MNSENISIVVSRRAPNWPAMVQNKNLKNSKLSTESSRNEIRNLEIFKNDTSTVSEMPNYVSAPNPSSVTAALNDVQHDEIGSSSKLWLTTRSYRSSQQNDFLTMKSETSAGPGRLLRQCDNCKLLFRHTHTCHIIDGVSNDCSSLENKVPVRKLLLPKALKDSMRGHA